MHNAKLHKQLEILMSGTFSQFLCVGRYKKELILAAEDTHNAPLRFSGSIRCSITQSHVYSNSSQWITVISQQRVGSAQLLFSSLWSHLRPAKGNKQGQTFMRVCWVFYRLRDRWALKECVTTKISPPCPSHIFMSCILFLFSYVHFLF